MTDAERLTEIEGRAAGDARPEIALFAQLMEARMARHDGDWGDSWKRTPAQDVLGQIEYALNELRIAYWYGSATQMVEKAADLANFAMMAAFTMSDMATVIAALAAREGE